jgi:hypothetical protein
VSCFRSPLLDQPWHRAQPPFAKSVGYIPPKADEYVDRRQVCGAVASHSSIEGMWDRASMAELSPQIYFTEAMGGQFRMTLDTGVQSTCSSVTQYRNLCEIRTHPRKSSKEDPAGSPKMHGEP